MATKPTKPNLKYTKVQPDMRLNNNPYKRNWSGGAVQCRKKAGCLIPWCKKASTGAGRHNCGKDTE